MLVLSRKTKETIMIGDDIEITVLSTSGSQVRIGISAPNDISVHRQEIYELIKSEENDVDSTQAAEG